MDIKSSGISLDHDSCWSHKFRNKRSQVNQRTVKTTLSGKSDEANDLIDRRVALSLNILSQAPDMFTRLVNRLKMIEWIQVFLDIVLSQSMYKQAPNKAPSSHTKS